MEDDGERWGSDGKSLLRKHLGSRTPIPSQFLFHQPPGPIAAGSMEVSSRMPLGSMLFYTCLGVFVHPWIW
jgi:hypothetical protein